MAAALTFGTKIAGACLCCGTPCYAILQADPSTGRPLVLGAAEEHQTQVEFLLSDGSEADITFCIECAAKLEPEHYPAIWRACVEAFEAELAGRSRNERIAKLLSYTKKWILARLRHRRHDPSAPGRICIDRRVSCHGE